LGISSLDEAQHVEVDQKRIDHAFGASAPDRLRNENYRRPSQKQGHHEDRPLSVLARALELRCWRDCARIRHESRVLASIGWNGRQGLLTDRL
jgi:hypothetical protein